MKELVNPVHHVNRSGKDLSHRVLYTCNLGELMPVMCEEMVPNDYFEVDIASLVRTFPLQTAAFVRAKICFDFFFVPMTAVWRNFDKFYYQRDDNFTSFTRNWLYEPNIKLSELKSMCDSGYTGTTHVTSSQFDTPEARYRLLQLLGYGDVRTFNTSGATYNRSLSALPIYAYNRIYNLWYRNAWRDEPSESDVMTFSADNLSCEDYEGSLVDAAGTNNLFKQPLDNFVSVHFHSYPKDLYMGSMPNSQFGDVSTVETSLTTDHGFTTKGTSWTGPAHLRGGLAWPTVGQEDGSVLDAAPQTFSILDERKAIALQKWKEYNMRAGWKSSSQARAMFGVNVPTDRAHDVEYIDGFHFPLMIDEIAQTTGANDVSSPLGELGGKAIGVGNGNKVKFSSGERFGYFFCIAYVLPDTEYDAVGLNPMLVRSEPEDHYMPAFENLGMAPIYKWMLNFGGNSQNVDSVLGYAPRYFDYKTRVDKVTGRFMTGRDLTSWTSPRFDLEAMSNYPYLPSDVFYVSPSVYRNLFYAIPDGTDLTNQFMMNVHISNKAVRPMSDLGLPIL